MHNFNANVSQLVSSCCDYYVISKVTILLSKMVAKNYVITDTTTFSLLLQVYKKKCISTN